MKNERSNIIGNKVSDDGKRIDKIISKNERINYIL